MQIDELLQRVLSLPRPWTLTRAELMDGEKVVEVHVVHDESQGACPSCSKEVGKHDTRTRRWRHLDLCDHQTWIVCEVPRVKCPEHGVHQVAVPWADGWSRFTAQFECLVIDWLKEASLSAVARNHGLSWDQVYGIQSRAVARGLARRGPLQAKRIGIDETSFQKRHEYVTIVTDQALGQVLYVADGRKQESLNPFFESLNQGQRKSIEVVAMDMHDPFINSAIWYVPDIEEKLCFDRFHVAQHFGRAVDQTRRAENKDLLAKGDDRLKGTKFHWLKKPASLPRRLRKELANLCDSALLVAEVWAVKEAASKLWHYKSRTWARKAWSALCDWAESVGCEPLKRVAKTMRYYMLGIVNAVVLKASNAGAESINSRVQSIKRRANGYRNRERFRDAILFHLGGLDLYPWTSIHTND